VVHPAVKGRNFWPEFSEMKISGAEISALSEPQNFRPLAGISGVSRLQWTDFELAYK
jgi:hypothetical protein